MTAQASREFACRGFAKALGLADPGLLAQVAGMLNPRWIRGGEVVFRQGDAADELFFVISGRLQVFIDLDTPAARMVSEVVRGETLGEMGVIARMPRTATVRAVRDCELLALSRTDIEALLRSHPEVSLALARQVILRLARRDRPRADKKRPVFVAVVGTEAGVCRSQSFVDLLARAARRHGRVQSVSRLDAAAVLGDEAHLLAHHSNTHGSESGPPHDRIAAWFDDLETNNDLVLLAVSDERSWWGRHCLRHSDEILGIADGGGSADPLLPSVDIANRVAPGVTFRLVLIHPQERLFPTATGDWFSPGVASVTHVRAGCKADFERLARVVARRSTGVAFSGGGARGFAHLGVYKALSERDVPIDAVAGTSMGAAIGSLVALGCSPKDAISCVREIFRGKPASDFNWIPLVSLIGGHRLKAALERTFCSSDGTPLYIEDCWKPFYCVVSDFSSAQMKSYRRGPIATLVRASMALPGLMPPVFHEGSALIDGGVFNNLPTDVLRNGGIDHVIAVDLRLGPFGPSPDVGIPSPVTTLRNWISAKGSGRPGIPSMRELLIRVPSLNSESHHKHAASLADVLLRPEVSDVGIVNWSALDLAIDRGYTHTVAQLDAGAFDSILKS